jgi:hypothetical protein
MTQEQLYTASDASGLKNMSWAEFGGQATSVSNTTTTYNNKDKNNLITFWTQWGRCTRSIFSRNFDVKDDPFI